MGRPALGFEATKIRLPAELKKRATALVGERGLAGFIREAMENELARREAAERHAGNGADDDLEPDPDWEGMGIPPMPEAREADS